jgi:hypothetical protein
MKNSPKLGKLVVIGTLNGDPGKFYRFKTDTSGRVVASFKYDARTASGMGRSSDGNYLTQNNVKLTKIESSLSENQGGSSNDIKSKIEKMKNSPKLDELVVIGTLNGREGEFYDFKNSMGSLVAYFNAYTGSNARSVPITRDNVKLTKIESSLEEAEEGTISTKDETKAEKLAKKGLNVNLTEKEEDEVEKEDNWNKPDKDDKGFDEKEPSKKELEKIKVPIPSKFKVPTSDFEDFKTRLKTLVKKIKDMEKGAERDKKMAALKQFIKKPELVKAFKERDVKIDTDGLVG